LRLTEWRCCCVQRVDVMKSNINAVLVWTVCSLVASLGCRCGTLHDLPPDPYNSFDQTQSPIVMRGSERIDAIKTDILGKLGLEDVQLPQPASNVTTDERKRAMQLYRQLRGRSHRLAGVEDEQLGSAKQFFIFSALQPGMIASSRQGQK